MLGRKRNVYKEKPCKQDPNMSLSTQGSCSTLEEEAPNRNEKLELCRKFTEQGHCSYGRKCKFAHGRQELRQNNATNCRYKTKECYTYCEEAFCKFGLRCNFVHTPYQRPNAPSHLSQYAEVKQFATGSSALLKMLHKLPN